MSAPTTALPLETLSEQSQPPKKRVAKAQDAQTIVQSLIYSNRERARFNSKIKGMLDGNPPYDSAKLKALGQSYRANVNFMEGESALSAALVPYYDLFAGSQTYAEVRLYLDNPDDAEYKSRIITEEFDCLLKKYAAFEFNMHGMIYDFVAHGKGCVMFPAEWGWHFNRVAFNRVYVPDGTDASVEKVEVLVIREKMQVHALWNAIQKERAQEAGWNKDACCEAIRSAMPEESTSQTNDVQAYEWVQQRMRDRDIVEGTRQPTVPVAHLLVKEFDGKITHMMIEEHPRQASTQSNNGPVKESSKEVKFLFEKTGRFEQMRHAVSAFFFETLDGSWNGARGLGHKIYSSMEIKNRLLNKIVDNAFLSGGITLQAKDANSVQKTSLVQAGDFNIIPPGYEVQNAQIFARSEGLVGTNQLLDQTIASNTGIFKAKPEKPQGNPETATAASLRFQHATVLSNSGVSRFYSQLDPFYSELYRRVTTNDPLESDQSEEAKAVREFKSRCKKRGVTAEDLKKVESVRAVRNIGNGSQFQRQQSLTQFTPLVPMLTEGGRQAWMQDVVASYFGQAAVSRYIPERDKQLKPNDQQAMALLENAALRSGAPVAWTPTQNNVIHASEHLKAMSGAAESLQQGANPVEVLAFLEAAGPHVQVHLQQLAPDKSRAGEFKLLSDEFKKVAQFTDELHNHVQEQQGQAEEQQRAQAEAQARAAAIQGGTDPETMIATAKATHDMQLKEQKQAHAMSLKDAQTKQKLAVKDIEFSQKLRQQAAESAMKASQPEPAAK